MALNAYDKMSCQFKASNVDRVHLFEDELRARVAAPGVRLQRVGQDVNQKAEWLF